MWDSLDLGRPRERCGVDVRRGEHSTNLQAGKQSIRTTSLSHHLCFAVLIDSKAARFPLPSFPCHKASSHPHKTSMAATASKDLLRAQHVGRSLHQVATPSVVLDLAKVEANCNLMLDASQRLDLGWRAHIKTHKVKLLAIVGTCPIMIC